jgi:hypothetical protein
MSVTVLGALEDFLVLVLKTRTAHCLLQVVLLM